MSRKTAIVTGSTSGIGLAIAEALAESRCNILLNGFGEQSEIDAIDGGLRNDFGVEVQYSAADMCVSDQVGAMLTECHSHFGSVDVPINNAGIQYTSSVEEFPRDRWDKILAINLSSNFHAIQAALPIMR